MPSARALAFGLANCQGWPALRSVLRRRARSFGVASGHHICSRGFSVALGARQSPHMPYAALRLAGGHGAARGRAVALGANHSPCRALHSARSFGVALGPTASLHSVHPCQSSKSLCD